LTGAASVHRHNPFGNPKKQKKKTSEILGHDGFWSHLKVKSLCLRIESDEEIDCASSASLGTYIPLLLTTPTSERGDP